jgi:hypothetical protein
VPIRGVDKAVLLADIEKVLRRFASERKQALLIVDEAQNLTPRAVEELRMLSNFQTAGKALLQSFLVGQPELRRILQGPDMQQFRQRVIASYHLGPLDRQDTQAYIEHRLRQVRWTGDPAITANAYDALFAFTAGIPRRINLICNRLLLAGFLNEKHELDAADVEVVAGEIKEELGVVGQAAEGATATDTAEARLSMPAGGRRVVSKPVAQPRPGSTPDDASLLDRVARLESTLGRVHSMLLRVLRVIEPRLP